MNKASKKSYKDGSLKTVDRRIFNGMSRMWEKFLRYADDDTKCELFLRLALYVISVRRTGVLLTASFRFHLTMDTLTVQLYTSHYLGVFGTFTR